MDASTLWSSATSAWTKTGRTSGFRPSGMTSEAILIGRILLSRELKIALSAEVLGKGLGGTVGEPTECETDRTLK